VSTDKYSSALLLGLPTGGAPYASQFVVTKHHAYCVAAVQGQALLVKLGGQTSGTHEATYRNRFPEQVRV